MFSKVIVRMCATILSLCVWCWLVAALLANDTALHEGGSGPEPVGGIYGPESVIAMVREELNIEFGREHTDVRAKFVFRNTQKAAPARQIVGFPDFGAAQVEIETTGPLENLRTFVNGEECKSSLQYGWVRDVNGLLVPAEKSDEDSLLMAWHTIDVVFPVGEDVTIERRYRVRNGFVVGDPVFVFFEYTTATGGVWKGLINRLQADMLLRDGLTVDDLVWYGEPATNPGRKGWKIVSPRHLRLVWENFEPRTEENRRGFSIATKATKVPPEER